MKVLQRRLRALERCSAPPRRFIVRYEGDPELQEPIDENTRVWVVRCVEAPDREAE